MLSGQVAGAQSRYDSLDSCSALDCPEDSVLADMPSLCPQAPPTPMGMCYAPMPQSPRARTMPVFRSTIPKGRELPPFQVRPRLCTDLSSLQARLPCLRSRP